MSRKNLFKLSTLTVAIAWFVSCSGPQAAVDDEPAAETVADNPAEESAAPELIPTDGPGVIEQVRSSNAKAVLVNIWATWCKPCVEKFPEVAALRRKFVDKGLEVMFVSADFPEQESDVLAFLKGQGVDYPTYIKTGKDYEFIDAFEAKWNGALPVMFLYGDSGSLLREWGADADFGEIERMIAEQLD